MGVILHRLLPFRYFLYLHRCYGETLEGSGATSSSQQRMAQGVCRQGDLQGRVTSSRSSHCTGAGGRTGPGRGGAGRDSRQGRDAQGAGARTSLCSSNPLKHSPATRGPLTGWLALPIPPPFGTPSLTLCTGHFPLPCLCPPALIFSRRWRQEKREPVLHGVLGCTAAAAPS